MRYEEKWVEKGLYRRFQNHIRSDELVRLNQSLQGDKRFDQIRYVINDFLRVEDFVVDDDDVKSIAHFDRAAAISNPFIKIAVVSKNLQLNYWIEEYCKMLQGSSYHCQLFDDLAVAEEWVGIGL